MGRRVPEISAVAVVYDEEEVLAVLEGVGHVDDERVFEFLEEGLFVHN